MTDLSAPPATGEVVLYQTDDGNQTVQVRLQDGTVWLTQKLIADLYQTSTQNISRHLTELYEEGEIAPESTIKSYLIVRTEGSRNVRRPVDHYNLAAIVAVGFRVRSARGTAFRQWAIARLDEFLSKGFVMDDERLKSGAHLGTDYFDELLERIRDIRASERRFYQKITDIYAQCSVDYDAKSGLTLSFFKTVQNKLHWAVHGHTAAELIHERADSTRPNMGLTTWKNAPSGKIRQADVTVAKNYLDADELRELNRIVTMYLDYAEDQARKRPLRLRSDGRRHRGAGASRPPTLGLIRRRAPRPGTPSFPRLAPGGGAIRRLTLRAPAAAARPGTAAATRLRRRCTPAPPRPSGSAAGPAGAAGPARTGRPAPRPRSY